jgi:hypothetical protein
MNTTFFASALVAAATLMSASAFAAGADAPMELRPATVTTMARADVRMQAPAGNQGPVAASNQVDGSTLLVAPRASERSRADVRAETTQRSAGMAFNGAPGRS